eukprot:14029134-Alexandrium_andersonii.AAC.1
MRGVFQWIANQSVEYVVCAGGVRIRMANSWCRGVFCWTTYLNVDLTVCAECPTITLGRHL